MKNLNPAPTRYRINYWSVVVPNQVNEIGEWRPFISYSICEQERESDRDTHPLFQVTIEFCWQD